jgi:hypothetical protein
VPFTISAFLKEKKGCLRKECEDAVTVNESTLRLCVADGASDSFDSRTWAWLLAADWRSSNRGQYFDKESFALRLHELSLNWHRKWEKRTLPWYHEEKLRQGAFAAFLGVELELQPDRLLWKSLSLGDCCLFSHNLGEGIVYSFPFGSTDQFGNYPLLLSTHSTDIDTVQRELLYAEGNIGLNCSLLMMTDAIACWFMEANKQCPTKTHSLIAALGEKRKVEIEKMVDEERASGFLRNDDIGIILISHNLERPA